MILPFPKVSRYRPLLLLLLAAFISTSPAAAQTSDISSSPASLSFSNTFVGKATGSKVLTISNLLTSGQIIINSIAFDCSGGYALASGVAPFTLGQTQKITHYSIIFQPLAAQAYNCNFVISLSDGTSLSVPLTGTGLTSTATASVSPVSLNFPNQSVGTTSVPQVVTITNTGTTDLKLNTINLSPPSFTTNSISLPQTIKANASFPISISYTPSGAVSESGALDLTYDSISDNGTTLTGKGVASTSLIISNSPTLPQATQKAAYQATLAAIGGTGPYTWALASGSTLPSGLSLSTDGVISGTLATSVSTGNYNFTVQVTDTASASTAAGAFTLGVFANLGQNCNDISFNVPNTTTAITAITDLGTGMYQGSQAGLYPNGSNARPSDHDADGVSFARAIQPIDANGNPSPTGKYVLLAVGESTAQNEFNRFLPIANADPAKNPNLVLVNGSQGGATPNTFTSPTSVYWATTLNNYLPQNGVTANQVVAAWIEDTDGIASGSFPSDMTTLQSHYETMMQTMHTLFPNLKLVYFSSRVYGGYSNGVGSPPNPEPYAYETGFAVKWAIQDQLNGVSTLNYNLSLGPVVAPWMSWGPYYWSNGMLGRADGLVWDCEDFSADGTHPSSTYGQLKVATQLLNFFKTDDTTIPWYLAPNLTLTVTGGNNQSDDVGDTLQTPLTVLASNLNSGAIIPGLSVTFSDNGAGGTFNPTVATTDGSGIATTTYTLPSTAQAISITAKSAGYMTADFTETSNAVNNVLSVNAGNNQSGDAGATLPTPLSALATNNEGPVQGLSVTFDDSGAGGSFSPTVGTTDATGLASTTYTLPPTAQTVTVNATAQNYTPVTFTETANAVNKSLAANAGNSQTGNLGTTLPVALAVLATNNGNPVQGVSVTFNDAGAGGSFGTPTATTDSNGIASTTYTLPSAAQTVSVTATSSGYTAATFTETAASLLLAPSAGNNQSGIVGTALPLPLTVVATKNGSPVAGVSVAFTDGGAGGIFGTPIATTASDGTASSTYTLPATAQTVAISVTSSGYTSTAFSETATSSVTSVSVLSGGKQTGTVGTTLPNPVVAIAKNSTGKGVSGISVTFDDGAAGGTFSPNPAVTASNGRASATYTLPTLPKPNIVVTASVGSVKGTTTEKSVVGPPTNLTVVSGNTQTGKRGQRLAKNLVVSVTDQLNNPIQGVTVTFTDNAAGGSFSNPTPVTTTAGQVSVIYFAGSQAATVTITATTPTLGPVTFTETVK